MLTPLLSLDGTIQAPVNFRFDDEFVTTADLFPRATDLRLQEFQSLLNQDFRFDICNIGEA